MITTKQNAGGEVKVLAHVQGDRTLRWLSDNWRSIPKGTELVDRAHVTARDHNDFMQAQIDVKQSELRETKESLTKARELLSKALRTPYAAGQHIREFLANQPKTTKEI